jgi:geranyl-CoA carboxylase alpha subunit
MKREESPDYVRAPRARPFDTILVANRGEIAVRIIKSAHMLGFRAVAVYSEADAGMAHARAADIAVCIGLAAAAESYLNAAKLIDAARRTGAQAIHPGYGFLSESEEFAAECKAANLVFIGPSPEAIHAMANKATAKKLMAAAGVPCIPGYDGDEQDEAVLMREAERVGFPVMIKAIAGGGGKGMRLVESTSQLDQALRSARREALRAFGNGSLMLERAVTHARHVEVQVFGDSWGNVVHLGDRDCSIQRRHQKLIEEAPAPGLSQDLRECMGKAAVRAANAVNYEGAGTVEFLVTPGEEFFFLEMNTRLQVEHPVTEMVTGLDLVEWQIKIASGEPLPLTQQQVRLTGHAIEARVCAEDPATNFLPQSGRLSIWQPPDGAGIRVDHGLREGGIVSTHYDSMIAKVIASGETRDVARMRLVRALETFSIGGVRNNLSFLGQCLRHPAFANTEFDTGFIESHALDKGRGSIPDRRMTAVAAALFHERSAGGIDATLRNWQSGPARTQHISLAAGEWRSVVSIRGAGPSGVNVLDDAGEQAVIIGSLGSRSHIRVDGVDYVFRFAWEGDILHLVRGDSWFSFSESREAAATKAADGSAVICAPMPGSVTEIRVAAGAVVVTGQVLAILEAMKMEHQILAPVSGLLAKLDVTVGQQVTMRQNLMEIVSMLDTESSDGAA